MAAAIPRPPSRPSYGPPTTALPALPTTKTRKSTGAIPTLSSLKGDTSPPRLPKSGLRAPSTSGLPSSTIPGGSSSLPKLRTTPGVNAAGKTIRKTISINSFPQPPRGGVRTTSLPPSPLSGGLTPATSGSRRESTDTSLGVPGTPKSLKRRKTAVNQNTQTYSNGAAPSLLNGSGDSSLISSGAGARGSDGLLSLPSPPQSRSSSAQDSYSTSATNYDDSGDGLRGREASAEATADRRSSKPTEGKGNVIVSVRVRPDAGANGASKTDGEWMVDGRRSLVAYRGKEGGDYYYGMDFEPTLCSKANLVQIMFLLLTTIMLRFTILPPRDWFDGSWRGIMEQSLLMV
jgi:centromeric protein E